MKKTLLTAVSAIAILGSGPVSAENASSGSLTKDVKEAWKNTKEEASEAANTVSDAASDVYNHAKNAIRDNDDNAEMHDITIDIRKTAEGMISQPVYNQDGERVAKVRDIILDQDGQAVMVIMADGEFTGLGKLVAFDYNIITSRSADGDIIATLDEDMIDNAATFSYDRSKLSDTVRVIPSNGFSAAALLEGQLIDPNGSDLAQVDNIVFKEGQASEVIVGFGHTLGMGGKQAAMAFEEADITQHDDNVDLKLSASEAEDFNAYKKKVLN